LLRPVQNFDMNLDFADIEVPNVLDNFDFDSFLNPDTDAAFTFDGNMNFDGGLEAGGDV